MIYEHLSDRYLVIFGKSEKFVSEEEKSPKQKLQKFHKFIMHVNVFQIHVSLLSF